jgi:hypothetical protein
VLDPGAVLAPELVAGGGEAVRAPVDDVDGARASALADVFADHADGQVVAGSAPQVGRGQGRPEAVARLRDVLDRVAVLLPELVARSGEAAPASIDHVDRARVRRSVDVLAGGAYGEVGLRAPAEVACSQGEAELVARLRDVLDRVAVLLPELVAGGGEAVRAPVDDVHGARVRGRVDVLTGDADGEIVEAVAVKVPRGESLTEAVARLRGVPDPRAVLIPELVPRGRQPVRASVDHVHRARLPERADTLDGDADGEVGEPVAVEVRARGDVPREGRLGGEREHKQRQKSRQPTSHRSPSRRLTRAC